MRPWAQWFVNHHLKFVLYIIWLFALPFYAFTHIKEIAPDIVKDALSDLNSIHKTEKE